MGSNPMAVVARMNATRTTAKSLPSMAALEVGRSNAPVGGKIGEVPPPVQPARRARDTQCDVLSM